MSSILAGLLDYSSVMVVIGWLPALLLFRQAASRDAPWRGSLIVALLLCAIVALKSFDAIRALYPLTGLMLMPWAIMLYRYGQRWQANTLLYRKALALSPKLYPSLPVERDRILASTTLINTWLMLSWSDLLTASPDRVSLPFNWRVGYTLGAITATLLGWSIIALSCCLLGPRWGLSLRYPNQLVGGLLRILGCSGLITTLVISIRAIANSQ